MNLLNILSVFLLSLALVDSAPQTSLFESVEVEAISREGEVITEEVSTEVSVVNEEGEDEEDDSSWLPMPNWPQWQVNIK